jgi:serine/threonine-protein kinase
MKIIEGGGDDRIDREMEIYNRFKGLDGIPQIYRQSHYEGETVIFEQYIEGSTLNDIVSKYGRDTVLITKLIKDLFVILTPIWNDSYVHRDLKPENIIIRSNGTPVIIDFGIARDLGANSITGTGLQPGTWRWAAPEQLMGQKHQISYRTDFFSLGVLAYFLFHQKLPFGETLPEIHSKIKTNDETFYLDSDCGMEEFLTQTLKFRPSHRPREINNLIKLL